MPRWAVGAVVPLVSLCASVWAEEALGILSSPTDFDHESDQLEVVANNITVAALTLYIWEYLTTFPREITMYRTKMLRRPQVVLFLLIRYGTIPALVLPAYALWHHFDDADDCPKHDQITVALVQFLVACIFSWRTIAIWQRTRWVVVFLTTFSCMLLGTSVGLLYFSRDTLLVTGACHPSLRRDPSQYGVNTVQWFYLVSMIFDTVTMSMSTYKLYVIANMGRSARGPEFRDPFEAHHQLAHEEKQPPTHWATFREGRTYSSLSYPVRKLKEMHAWWASLTPLLARLFRNGLIYFFVATLFNLVNFILEAVNSIHAKSFLSLYPPFMCVLCQRMILTEYDAVYTKPDPEFEAPGRDLVRRVVGSAEGRERLGEINRFEEYVNGLKERHTSVPSSVRQPSTGARTSFDGRHASFAMTPTQLGRDKSPGASQRASVQYTPPPSDAPLPTLSREQQRMAVRMSGLEP